jgi:hypothetical protein
LSEDLCRDLSPEPPGVSRSFYIPLDPIFCAESIGALRSQIGRLVLLETDLG